MLGPLPFKEGDDAVLATLRHELEHAIHAQLILEIQRRWREALKKAGKKRPASTPAAQADFFAFADRQKLSPVDVALIHGGTSGNTANTPEPSTPYRGACGRAGVRAGSTSGGATDSV